MKKLYITPETFCTDVVAENMLAASQIEVVNDSYIESEAEFLSRESQGLWEGGAW